MFKKYLIALLVVFFGFSVPVSAGISYDDYLGGDWNLVLSGMHAGTAWYVTAVVLSVVLFVATPPVPGANLLAYIALFAQAGIPADALICAMIFDVFFGIFANAANQSLLQLDLVLQADRIGLLNRKALTRSIKSVRSSL